MGTDAYRIRLCGGGDFDVRYISTVLAEALAIYQEKNVVQQVAYGADAREAAASTDLVIAEGEIRHPCAVTADLVVALTREGVERYGRTVGPRGALMVEEEAMTGKAVAPAAGRSFPFLATARRLGDVRLANMVVVGAVAAATPALRRRAVEDAVLGRVPPGTEAIYLGAVDAGWNLVSGRPQ